LIPSRRCAMGAGQRGALYKRRDFSPLCTSGMFYRSRDGERREALE
jgi:hypothetical protein